MDGHEAVLLDAMRREAQHYLSGFHWCEKIQSSYFGFGIGGVFAVFMFEIENAAQPDHDLLWIIVGDFPPAYLIVKGGPENPDQALSVYVELMTEWVNAIRQGLPVRELIPVDVPQRPNMPNSSVAGFSF